jgi:hypothetical protein
MNINTATEEQLRCSIPSVGPQRAKHICEAREIKLFTSWEDLKKRVQGVGTKTLDVIKKHCVLEEPRDENPLQDFEDFLQEFNHESAELKAHREVDGIDAPRFLMFCTVLQDDEGNFKTCPQEIQAYHKHKETRDLFINDMICKIKVVFPKYWFLTFDKSIEGIDFLDGMKQKKVNPDYIKSMTHSRLGTGFFLGDKLMTAHHCIDEFLDGRIKLKTVKKMIEEQEAYIESRSRKVCAKHGDQPDDFFLKFATIVKEKLETVYENALTNVQPHVFAPMSPTKVYQLDHQCAFRIFFTPENSQHALEASIHKSFPEQDVLLLDPSKLNSEFFTPGTNLNVLNLKSTEEIHRLLDHMKKENCIRTYGYPEAKHVVDIESGTLVQSYFAQINRFEKFPKTWILRTSLDCYTGMSGSPVFLRKDGKYFLLGIYTFSHQSDEEPRKLSFTKNKKWSIMETGATLLDPSLLFDVVEELAHPTTLTMTTLGELIGPNRGLKRKAVEKSKTSKRQKTEENIQV